MREGSAASPQRSASLDNRASIGARLDEERRRASLRGDVREAIFGAQDGLVSTLAVVSTVSGATDDRFSVLVAGIATALAGEYLSSKSQREVALAQIAIDRVKVATKRTAAEAELAYMLEEEGLQDDEASAVAAVIARHPEVLLNTKVEKEFGFAIEEASGSPMQGALVMGTAFGLGALAPILPYLVLSVNVASSAAVLATGAVLFAIGIVKTRWTGGNPILSGIEILLVGAMAGVVGYLFGNLLPQLLGAPAAAG